MSLDRRALSAYINNKVLEEQRELDESGVQALLERGRQWRLGETLRRGGAVMFPHAGVAECGHQIAAAAQACLDSGADRVLALGVLHALSDELQAARVRVADGGDPANERAWGVQGPGLVGAEDWRTEFSMSHFQFLLDAEVKARGGQAPQVFIRYPYLVGGQPERLPGIEELRSIAQDAVIVWTADAFHHGVGYGDPVDQAMEPDKRGLAIAAETILQGLDLLQQGDYWGFNQHCVMAKNDARDGGQVMRYLRGPLESRILDIVATDTTKMYGTPPPTWVAAALVEQSRAGE